MPGLQIRLLADDAFTTNLLHFAVGVRDQPMARQQAGGHFAFVTDCDRVRENVAILFRIGLIVPVARLDIDSDLVHRCIVLGLQVRPTRTASTSQGAACRTVSSVKFTRIDRP